MTKPEESFREFYRRHQGAYRSLIQYLAIDLPSVLEVEPFAFDDLFFDREPFLRALKSELAAAYSSTANLLVTGHAGIGKSTAIYKLLCRETAFLEKTRFHPIITDYRAWGDKKTLLMHCVSEFLEYFDSVGCQCSTITQNTPDHWDFNRGQLVMHLRKVPANAKKPILFLDDFDYIDDDVFEFLDLFRPFAVSPACCVIFSARPLLYNAVNRHDDRLAMYFTRSVKHLKLKALDPYEVLQQRLAILLSDKSESSVNRLLSHRLSSVRNRFRGWLQNSGVESLDELRTFPLPFDTHFCHFMAEITNGNLREAFVIAEIALDRLLQEWDGEGPVSLSVEDIVELFSPRINDPGEIAPKYRLVDLFEYESKSHSPLLLAVLQAVQSHQATGDAFYDDLKAHGHPSDSVDWALRFLQEKTNRLISPKGLYPDRAVAELYPHLEVTKKGQYYLEHIALWPAYRERYGHERMKFNGLDRR